MSTRGVRVRVLAVGEDFAGGYLSEPSRKAYFLWIARRRRPGEEWKVELYTILHGDHRPIVEMKAMVLEALQRRTIRITETSPKVHSGGLYASGLITVADERDKQTFVWTAARQSSAEEWNPKHIGIDYLDAEPYELLASPVVLEQKIVKYLRRQTGKRS